MKATNTNIKNLLSGFDMQLLAILKDDLRQQNQKMKTKLINMATRSYDKELLAIIKADINKMKKAMGANEGNLAQAV
ncbi:hypothetical protein BCY91_05245 [Pelobium manganitolerans]|uniref:Uncharacterized protein n=1 Tax=Pelobium manganitolerans TaxID=1842495 RepID=A0A419S5Z5_9SPHI|nr:hypothetical protein [Pelobium manganitolerans]RKD16278.1 hypothetical protein BCY91_05245 [Pelobium manganitolerans]